MKFKKISPIVYPILVFLVFLLSFIGYSIYFSKGFHFWGVLYSIINFFLLNESAEAQQWADNPENPLALGLILAAKFIAAILVGLSLFSIFVDHAREFYLVYKIKFFQKRHIIVFSLDSLGYRISKELLENGYLVVVVETNRESPFVEEIINAGGVVIFLNPFESKTLEKIGLAKSRACILANDKDEVNIEIAANISLFEFGLNKEEGFQEPMKLFIHIKDQHNKRVLKDYSDIDNMADNYDLHVINLEQMAAQKIYDEYPPHLYYNEGDQNLENTIAVVGLDKTAQAFLLENVILSHYHDHKPLKIFLVDKHANTFFEEFKYLYPFYEEFVELIPIELLNANFHANFCNSENLIQELSNIKVAYFFGASDSEVINRANALRQFLYNHTLSISQIPLIVSLPQESEIFDFMNNSTLQKDQIRNLLLEGLNLNFIKRKSDTFTGKGIIEEGELIDIISRVINYYYAVCYELQSLISNNLNLSVSSEIIDELSGFIISYPETHFDFTEIEFESDFLKFASEKTGISVFELRQFATIRKCWNVLNNRKKESNRYAARHIQVKMYVLNEIGCVPPNRENIVKFYPKLAKLEHYRWSSEKLVFSYQFGPFPKNKKEKNIVKEVMKIHDQLIPYESLTQAEKDKDLNLFLLLPLVQILKKSTNK
jgi:hypothetical protein